MKDHLIMDVFLTLDTEREFKQGILVPYLKKAFTKKSFNKDKCIKGLERIIQRYINKCYKNEACRHSYFYAFKPKNWKDERIEVAKKFVNFFLDETKLNGWELSDQPFKVEAN